MSAAAHWEKEAQPTPDYYLTLENLKELEIPVNLEQTKGALQTSMKADGVPEKVRYLVDIGLGFPLDWCLEGVNIKPEYFACIHVAYTFASSLGILRDITQDIKDSRLNTEDAETLLQQLNIWMDNRIEDEYGWRKSVTVNNVSTNVEAYYRMRGSVKNADQKVSKEEMLQIVALFKDRFRKTE